jgi:hypothetical protein
MSRRAKRIRTFEDVPKLIGATIQGHQDHETMYWSRIDAFYVGDSDHKIVLDPEFQRGHVWTEEQQRRFVEYALHGGQESCVVIFNVKRTKPTWTFTCVDGLQRLTAVYRFMHDQLTVFDGLTCSSMVKHSEFKKFPWTDFRFTVSTTYLSDIDVLRFYLELNSNGTPHSVEEIARVQTLIEKNTK